MTSNVEDVLMQELLNLQVAELRLTGMYNSLRSTPADRRDTGEFLAHLAELDHRASEVERLLEQMPTAIPLSQRLVA
jgi:hypothetical protein